MKLRALIIGAAFAAMTGVAAHAADLVTNGDFETGDFTGWSLSGNTGFTGVDSSGVGGSDGAYLGAVGSDTLLSQNIAATDGGNYKFSFDLANDGGTPNDFFAIFDGHVVLGQVDLGAFAYTHYSYNVTAAASGPHYFEFDVRQDPAYFHLDNVSVTAVPEPASWALMLSGFMGVGALLRANRRRTAVATA